MKANKDKGTKFWWEDRELLKVRFDNEVKGVREIYKLIEQPFTLKKISNVIKQR